MARTIEMRLIELMVLKQDIATVIEYLGKKGSFQFQSQAQVQKTDKSSGIFSRTNIDHEFYDNLQQARIFLNVADNTDADNGFSLPTEDDRTAAAKLLDAVSKLKRRVTDQSEEAKRIDDACKEALAFSNLKVPYSELDNLSFLTLRIGRIDPNVFEDLKSDAGSRAVIIPLGEDKSHILAASSRKGRFALDTELKQYGFVNMEIPKDFQGIPDDVLESLRKQQEASGKARVDVEKERDNFAETHAGLLRKLLGSFSTGMQVFDQELRLESTELVYRITGWIPAPDCREVIRGLDKLTEGRIAIREYLPSEVPSVLSGKEQVPVKLHHGKFVSSFERMIFSYGSPLYGSIDPTPFVAIFFTLLFGIMFGDLGQGMIFLIIGILMARNLIKVGGWNKFAPIFMAIGISSSIMGLLTGEFFSNETLLAPFARWVTGLFGTPRAPIVKMMPSSDPASIKIMFTVFGIAVGIGFIINSCGLVINLINRFHQRQYGQALFGKTGLAGAGFFWYVVVMVVRMAVFHHRVALYDWIIIGVTLFFAAFGEPFERLVDGKHPVIENGFGTVVISGFVEVIEVFSSYLSNTVSFLRVGAFALAHAVLDYIILTMTTLSNPVLGVVIMILGNTVVVVLEGMIVAIQVIRLQYYEFFSKFFNETGREFKPFSFRYGKVSE